MSYALWWISGCRTYVIRPVDFTYKTLEAARGCLAEFRAELLGCCRDRHDYFTLLGGTVVCMLGGACLFEVSFAPLRTDATDPDCLIPGPAKGVSWVDITSRM